MSSDHLVKRPTAITVILECFFYRSYTARQKFAKRTPGTAIHSLTSIHSEGAAGLAKATVEGMAHATTCQVFEGPE